MWQVLLAAAVAGSGILAKKLIIDHSANEPISSSEQDDQQCDVLKDSENLNESPLPKDSVFTCIDGFSEAENEMLLGDRSIFMFSSTSSSELGPKSLRRKMAGGMKGNGEGFKRNVKGKEGKKCGVVGCGKQGWVADQRKGGKRLSFFLKKRRTSKNITGKCQSCASKGNSFFTWGLSVGMMYMMSTGKAEISRLYNSMDETAKIVQELKAELSRRKGLQNKFRSTDAHATITKSNSQNTDALDMFGIPMAEEGECASSVLTEDRQIEALGMDQLEAELECELEKLPWSSKEIFGFAGSEGVFESDNLAREYQPAGDQDMISHQFSGIQPSELDQKLSHLLIEQQESHITDLEAKLERTHSKLCEKEAELQALKDCVRRLTEVSLEDEDTKFQMEDQKTDLVDQEMNRGPQSTKSVVGMKRAMDFESLDGFAR